MDPTRTDEEQVQALKKWWSENGVSTLLSVAVAVAAVLGWRGWQAQQEARAEAAAYAYQGLQQKVVAAAESPDDIKIAAAMHDANVIKEEFGNTGYAQFAALAKARQAMLDEEYETAATELRWVIEETPSPQLREIARLRLARALLAAADHEAALAALALGGQDENVPGQEIFNAQKAELAGDIYSAMDNFQAALEQYSRAESLTAGNSTRLPLLAVKLGYAKSRI